MPVTFSQSLQSASDAASLQGQESSTSFTENAQQNAQQGHTASASPTPTSFFQHSHRPAEYIGYYVGQSPLETLHSPSTIISSIPTHVGLAIQNGGLSPRGSSPIEQSPFISTTPPIDTLSTNSAPSISARGRKMRSKSNAQEKAPELISLESGVLGNTTTTNDGPPEKAQTVEDSNEQVETMTFSATTSEDLTFDTPSSSDNQSQAEPEGNMTEFEQNLSTLVTDRITSSTDKGFGPATCPEQAGSKAEICVGDEVSVATTEPLDKDNIANSSMHNEIQNPSSIDMKLTALQLGEQLLPMTATRSPSPSREALSDGQRPGAPKGSKSSSKGKIDKSKLSTTQDAPESIMLSSKPNGQVSALPVGLLKGPLQISGWQTQKKRKKPKKAVKPENDVDLVNVSGGDVTPVDDALRKGG
jgi:hypothetical protein